MNQVLTTVFVFILGTIFGSFLNVVIYRVPQRLSVVRPGSRCPHCQTPIQPYDNIPLVSFLILRGRCRACRAPISWRYPLVEGVAGLLLASLWLRFAPSAAWVTFTADAGFALMLVAVFFIDLDHQIVPNAITYPGLVVGLLLAIPQGRVIPSVLAAVGAGAVFFLIQILSSFALRVKLSRDVVRQRSLESHGGDGDVLSVQEPDSARYEAERLLIHLMVRQPAIRTAVREALLTEDFLDASHRELAQALLEAPDVKAEMLLERIADEEQRRLLLQLMVEKPPVAESEMERIVQEAINAIRGGMGGGDIKLAAMIGAFLGWPATAVALFCATAVGAGAGLLLIAAKKRTSMDAIPFGPSLAVGGILALFAADAIIRWYLDWFGLP